MSTPDSARVGVFVGIGDLRAQLEDLAAAMAQQTADARDAWARGLSRLHPLWMLRYLSNSAHALIAAELGFVGDGATFAGPASAASAICAAEAALLDGAIEAAIVVALDDATSDEVAVELAAREPSVVPARAIAAIAVTAGEGALALAAVDGIDPHHAQPPAHALAALCARLEPADREVAYRDQTGWAGAAQLLLDALVGVRLHAGSSLASVAASPGQLGAIRAVRR